MTTDHQNWRLKAKCKDLTSEEADNLFFLGRGGSTNKAKEFCSTCLVKVQCLNFSLYYKEDGIWAGMSSGERNALPSVIGILSSASVAMNGVNVNETRDQSQWGLAEHQILAERRKYQEEQRQDQRPLAPVYSLPSVAQSLNSLPLTLVVEL